MRSTVDLRIVHGRDALATGRVLDHERGALHVELLALQTAVKRPNG